MPTDTHNLLRDPFELLEISLTADKVTINKAFRRLAKLHHPDTSQDPNADEKMKDLIWAKKILLDPATNAIYRRKAENQQRENADLQAEEAARKRAAEQERRKQAEEDARKRAAKQERRKQAEDARKRASEQKRLQKQKEAKAQAARKSAAERQRRAAAKETSARQTTKTASKSQQTKTQARYPILIITIIVLFVVFTLSNNQNPSPSPETVGKTPLISVNSNAVPTRKPTQRTQPRPTQVPTSLPTQVPTSLPTKVPTSRPTQVATTTPNSAVTNISQTTLLKITDSDVRLRMGPGLEYDIFGHALELDLVKVTGKSEDGQWYQIEHSSDNRLWVSDIWSSIHQGDLSRVPVVKAPPLPIITPGSDVEGGACSNIGMWTDCGGWSLKGKERDVICELTEVGYCQDDATWVCKPNPSQCPSTSK